MVKKKIKLTHNVPQAVQHRVVEVQHLGAVGLRMGRGRGEVCGLHVCDEAVEVFSGVPLPSSQDHLLLEPFHLKNEGTKRVIVLM